MTRYILLNIVFLAIAGVVAYVRRRQLSGRRGTWFKVAFLLLLMTLVFDNIIILLQIVGYDPKHLLGLYIFKAPIEDFGYTLGAMLLIPAIWEARDEA